MLAVNICDARLLVLHHFLFPVIFPLSSFCLRFSSIRVFILYFSVFLFFRLISLYFFFSFIPFYLNNFFFFFAISSFFYFILFSLWPSLCVHPYLFFLLFGLSLCLLFSFLSFGSVFTVNSFLFYFLFHFGRLNSLLVSPFIIFFYPLISTSFSFLCFFLL